MNDIYEKICEIAGTGNVRMDEPMREHTSFKVGGPADIFVMPKNADILQKVISLINENDVDYFICGNGTNLLVSDKGYRGVVININGALSDIKVEANIINAFAGASLASIAKVALENALSGFEFAAGIPGTLGGACVMNAGAYDGEMKDVLRSVILLENNKIIEVDAKDLDLGYRKSNILKREACVISAKIELENGDPEKIRSKINELAQKRKEKQPLDLPSAGSAFKRPEGYFAGKLISDAGLKGYSIGGAEISTKHAGFIVNKGDASAKDIYELIKHVQIKVKEDFGVELQREIKLLGDFE